MLRAWPGCRRSEDLFSSTMPAAPLGCIRAHLGSNADTFLSKLYPHQQRHNMGSATPRLVIPSTRISCHAALNRTACAPFRKERRVKFASATKFHRKSGEAKGPAVRLHVQQRPHE
jgi:hypothetical protein